MHLPFRSFSLRYKVHSTVFRRTSGKAVEYKSESGEYQVELEGGTLMGIKATKLIKVVDDLTNSDDDSSGDEGEGEAEGVGDGEDELASQAVS